MQSGHFDSNYNFENDSVQKINKILKRKKLNETFFSQAAEKIILPTKQQNLQVNTLDFVRRHQIYQ